LAVALTMGAYAAEPLGFKGQSLGASNVPIAQDPRFDCRVVRTPAADQVCSLRPREQETIAGAPVTSLHYFYDRARLTGIVISLPESHFQAVTRALQAKYGKPQINVERVKNLKGDPHENLTLTWRQGNAFLEAQRYAGRLDRSLVRLRDEEAALRVEQRTNRRPAQDL
jgi:hypothetical protein